jgi:hypothetical protein
MQLLTEKELLPGDVFLYVPEFVKKPSWISLFIAKSENDIESHTAIYVGSGMVFESLSNGPQWNSLSDSIKDAKEVKVYRYLFSDMPTEAELMKIISINNYEKRGYGWFNLISQLLFIKSGYYFGSKKNKSAIICSVLVADIWNKFYNNICQQPWTFTPASWSKYCYFTCKGFLK